MDPLRLQASKAAGSVRKRSFRPFPAVTENCRPWGQFSPPFSGGIEFYSESIYSLHCRAMEAQRANGKNTYANPRLLPVFLSALSGLRVLLGSARRHDWKRR